MSDMASPKEQLYYLGNKALIRDDVGKVLILHVRRKSDEDYWDLPGGRVNKGEKVTDALAREVEEETGITDLTIRKHLATALTVIHIPISEGEMGGLILSVYACSIKDVPSLKAEQGIELTWCSSQELLQHIAQYPDELKAAIARELSV